LASLLQVFVGALDPSVSEEQLRAVFAPFGELVYVKIPLGKNCGFVQFVSR
jgi:RNA recognition motif-containing protein